VPEPEPVAPTGVEVDRERGVTLTWPDGAASRFGLEELRVNCPCAECRGLRERDQAVWPTPSSPHPLRVEGAELVGAWGLSLRWNDGHSTGIFAWEILRRWRPGADASEHEEPPPAET
jgi:DUF971 family protein